MAKIQSVEPNIADLANGWLKSYKRDYKLEQESLNTEIDQALNDYYSKNGGVGGNRPDAKLLLQDKNLVNYPILIEYKGYKDMDMDSLRRVSDALGIPTDEPLAPVLERFRKATQREPLYQCIFHEDDGSLTESYGLMFE